ncbi:MAG: DNA-deoxyinosine glycosylase [Clostridia bacterium]
MFNGFSPIYDKESRILILGSFPSVISRKVDFYYGNARNRFWSMMETLYDVKLVTTQEKIQFLRDNHIALWDIVDSCEIQGSQDSKISQYKVNDLSQILSFAKIEKILCNGKTAYDITTQNNNNIETKIIYMQSTSPANPRFDIKGWADELESKY